MNPLKDSDGIPPGLDVELTGQHKFILFTGKFYATPNLGKVNILRSVRITIATKEVYVAQDTQHNNLYVVLRANNLSTGCRMTATLFDYNETSLAKFKEMGLIN